MSRVAIGLGLVLGALLVLCPLATVQAQGDGVVEGRVQNGTAGAGEVGAGLVVTLYALQGGEEVNKWEATTDASGRFRFEGLDTDATLEYWPEVVYLDVPYSTEAALQFSGGATALDATVTVYETTDDDSAIRIDSAHMIAESFGEVLRISEIHLLGNGSDRTYVGRDGLTAFIPLPEQAVGLAFQEGTAEERFVQVEGGLQDTEPLVPGSDSSLVFFSYHLMVAGNTVPLERTFAYPVTILNMLVAQPGLSMTSAQMLSQGAELFQGQQYEFFVASNLAPGEPLAVEFRPEAAAPSAEGMPGAAASAGQSGDAGATRGSQPALRWMGFALAALAVLGVVVYASAVRPRAAAHVPAPDLTGNPEARRLLSDLAELEEAFGAGQIDGAVYERQRAELYEALKSL